MRFVKYELNLKALMFLELVCISCDIFTRHEIGCFVNTSNFTSYIEKYINIYFSDAVLNRVKIIISFTFTVFFITAITESNSA